MGLECPPRADRSRGGALIPGGSEAFSSQQPALGLGLPLAEQC